MIHVVRSGDTVTALARQYGVGEDSILYFNQIPPPYTLVVGQALLIPEQNPDTGRLSIEVNGFAYPFISPWVLDQTLPYLNLLSVFSYGFTPEGKLTPPWLSDDLMRRRAAGYGVPTALVLTPLDASGMFSNRLITRLLQDPAAQDRLLAEIVQTMDEKGFSELNIDFEYVLAEDRERFSEFVERAAATLRPLGYRLSIDLAPKTSANQRGTLYEGKDYARLGAAVDRALLMTYEWGYKYGPPLPVAPLPQVRQVVEYALTEIPAEKLSLGLPNYGYDWPLPYVRGTTAARTISPVEAIELAKLVGTEIQYDETYQAPFFTYTNRGVEHIVWFEDVRSWQAKFALLEEAGLTGLGIWQVMRLYRAGLQLIRERFGNNS